MVFSLNFFKVMTFSLFFDFTQGTHLWTQNYKKVKSTCTFLDCTMALTGSKFLNSHHYIYIYHTETFGRSEVFTRHIRELEICIEQHCQDPWHPARGRVADLRHHWTLSHPADVLHKSKKTLYRLNTFSPRDDASR